MHNAKCAAMHLDVWAVKSDWIVSMVQAIKSGTVHANSDRVKGSYDPQINPYSIVNGVAVIELEDALMKGWSKYGGTSTLWARAAIRDADRNKAVKSILLHIDSPGGTSAGTAELGDDIRNTKKPIHAHIDDLGASAAYWCASQADSISMNRAGFAGSVGTYAAIRDYSGSAAMEGIKVHVISTGPYKGLGEPGTEISSAYLAEWQDIINKHFSHFQQAVQSGRQMTAANFKRISDGRVFDSRESKAYNLIDRIESFDKALMRLTGK